jgi:dihydroxy-acid dehydratase
LEFFAKTFALEVLPAGPEVNTMDAKSFSKAKLPSRHVTEGPQRAPHRSYYYAMGLTREQIHQPFVGVALCGKRRW